MSSKYVNGDWYGKEQAELDAYTNAIFSGERVAETFTKDANLFIDIDAAAAAAAAGDKLYAANLTTFDSTLADFGNFGGNVYLSTGSFDKTAGSDTVAYLGDSDYNVNMSGRGDAVDEHRWENLFTDGSSAVIGLDKNGQAVTVDTVTGFETVTIKGGAAVNNVSGALARLVSEPVSHSQTDGYTYGITKISDYERVNEDEEKKYCTLTIKDATVGLVTGFANVTLEGNAKWTDIRGGYWMGGMESRDGKDVPEPELRQGFGTIDITGVNHTADGTRIGGFLAVNLTDSHLNEITLRSMETKTGKIYATLTVKGNSSLQTLNFNEGNLEFAAGAVFMVGTLRTLANSNTVNGSFTVKNLEVSENSVLLVDDDAFKSLAGPALEAADISGTLMIDADVEWSDLARIASFSNDSSMRSVAIHNTLNGVAGNIVTLRAEKNNIAFLTVGGDITGEANDKVKLDLGVDTRLVVNRPAFDKFFDATTGDIAGTLQIVRLKENDDDQPVPPEQYTWDWFIGFTGARTIHGLTIDTLLDIGVADFVTGDYSVKHLSIADNFRFSSNLGNAPLTVTISSDTSLSLGELSQDMVITAETGAELRIGWEGYSDGLRITDGAAVTINADISLVDHWHNGQNIGRHGGISVNAGSSLTVNGTIDFSDSLMSYLLSEGALTIDKGSIKGLNGINLTNNGSLTIGENCKDAGAGTIILQGENGSQTLNLGGLDEDGDPIFYNSMVLFSGTAPSAIPAASEEWIGVANAPGDEAKNIYLTINGAGEFLQFVEGAGTHGHLTIAGSNLQYIKGRPKLPAGIQLSGSVTLTGDTKWDEIDRLLQDEHTAIIYSPKFTISGNLSAAAADVYFSYNCVTEQKEMLFTESFTVTGSFTGGGNNLTVNAGVAFAANTLSGFKAITVEADGTFSAGTLTLAAGEKLTAKLGNTITVTAGLSVADQGGITIDAAAASQAIYKLIAGYEGIDYGKVSVTGYNAENYTVKQLGNDLWLQSNSAFYMVVNTNDSGEGSLRYGVETLQAPVIAFDPALAGAKIALESALLVTGDISISGNGQKVSGPEITLTDGNLQLENIAFTVDVLTMAGDNTLNIAQGAAVTTNELVVEAGASTITGGFSFANSRNSQLIVEQAASLTIDASLLETVFSANFIAVAGKLIVNGDVEWQDFRAIRENSYINDFQVTGAIRNFDKFTIGKASNLTLNATALTGTDKNNSFTLKENATGFISAAIDLGAGKNSISVGANAAWYSESVANVGSLKLAAGKSYKGIDGKKVQGRTYAMVEGNFLGIDGKNTLSFGKYSDLDILGNLGSRSAGNAKSSVKLGSEARFSATGDVFGLNSLNLANGKVYVDDTGARVWSQTSFAAGNVTGTAANDSIKLGGYAEFTAASLDLGAGKNSVSVGAASGFYADGDVKGLDSLKLASGKKAKGEATDVTNVTVAGTLTADKIQLGADALLYAAAIRSNGGALTVKAGACSIFTAGVLSDLRSFTVSSGKAETLSDAMIRGNFTGTAGNDTVKLGNYCDFQVKGGFDLGDGKNKVTVGKNSTFRVDGNLANVTELKVGKESTLILSTEAVAALDTIAKASYDWGYTIADIGKIGVASAFTTLDEELADNTLASKSSLGKDTQGWLSNKEDYGDDDDITCWNDLADYFQAGGVTDDLSGWQVTGDAGTLKVKVWKNDGSAWDGGTEITEADGLWDLSQVSITGASDYRISVEIADSAAKDAYRYQLLIA